MLDLLLFLPANETTKPVFDAILEATGENGKSRGKSCDDFLSLQTSILASENWRRGGTSRFQLSSGLCSRFTLEDPRRKHEVRAVHAKGEKFN